MKKLQRKRLGFTLIELLVVMAILSILADCEGGSSPYEMS